MGFFLRWLCAFVLLAATYNPTDWNYIRWAFGPGEAALSMIVLLGLLLAICYIIYLRATLRSIGLFGMLLILAVVGTILWVLFDFGWISLRDPTVNTWIAMPVRERLNVTACNE